MPQGTVSPWQGMRIAPPGAPGYCTLGELKLWLQGSVPPDDPSKDALLGMMIRNASRLIDRLCGVAEGSFATTVAGTVGVPDALRQLALELSARKWKRADAPFGVMGSVDTGLVRVGADEQYARDVLTVEGYLETWSSGRIELDYYEPGAGVVTWPS